MRAALVPGAVLVDNASEGRRLLQVDEVTADRVRAHDRRTGRRTSLRVDRVDGSPRGFS